VITGIQLLRSVGQFDYVPAGAIALDRFVLIYAENGRGKTTLTAILRSLATGDPLPIRERRRLAALNPPHVVLSCSTGQTPAVFENGAWNRTFPNIVIFDDRFVDENVYSGLNVEAGHRQNLHGLVLGAQGVTLNHQLQELVKQIEDHNTTLRTRAAAIPTAERGPFSVDDFCALPAEEDIDRQIRLAEQNLAAAEQQYAVRNTPGFEDLDLPDFDVEGIRQTLARDLPNMNAAAAALVQAHFREIGLGGEPWVADGVRRVVHRDGGTDLCPFCEQDLAGSAVIRHYAVYFGGEYAELKHRVTEALTVVSEIHDRGLPARFERAVSLATQRREFWSRFCEVPEIALDTEGMMQQWQAGRDGLVAALEAKKAAPLERLEISAGVRAVIENYSESRRTVGTLNERFHGANTRIQNVKERAALEDLRAAAAVLARLRAMKSRHTQQVSRLCDEYEAAVAAKALTEEARDRMQSELEAYRAAAFPQYEQAMNRYLARFNAGYRVGRVTPADTRGGPTCNYVVVINNTPIPIAGAPAGPGEPAFRSTLSSGDRNTLALAFFFTSLDRDPNLADKVVVIDDPASSLDEHRSLTTVQELRQIGNRVSQLIILSHDKSLLLRIWQGIDQTHCSKIKIEREGDGSNIVDWDVSNDSITEHDRNHALLRSHLQNGPGDNSREVAAALRPVLEAFLRVAYPQHFPPRPGALREFRRVCRQRLDTDAEILNRADTEELDDLVEYANLFHHNTNADWQQVVINDGELRGFVERALRFSARQ
jgi:wobble nucleotide-excising tRNase